MDKHSINSCCSLWYTFSSVSTFITSRISQHQPMLSTVIHIIHQHLSLRYQTSTVFPMNARQQYLKRECPSKLYPTIFYLNCDFVHFIGFYSTNRTRVADNMTNNANTLNTTHGTNKSWICVFCHHSTVSKCAGGAAVALQRRARWRGPHSGASYQITCNKS